MTTPTEGTSLKGARVSWADIVHVMHGVHVMGSVNVVASVNVGGASVYVVVASVVGRASVTMPHRLRTGGTS